MFQIGKTIISEEIIEKDFVCNLSACKGACCIDGDAGAPLEEKETEIFRDQVKGKPEKIIEKIIEGKLEKYYGTVALLEQGFVKDPDQPVGELLKAKGAEIGDDGIVVKRFTRYAVGEELDGE